MLERRMRTVSCVRPPGSGLKVNQSAADRAPMRMAQQGDGDEYQVEHGGDERDALPGPVAMGHQRDEEDEPCAEDGDGGRDAEESEAGADGDELGDQREEVADHEVDHREPSPEGAEAVEDEFGVTAVGGGAETHGHFLHDAGHEEREDYEGKEEADAVAGSGGGVRQHAGAVVFAEHDEDAGTDEQPEEAGAGPGAVLGAGGADAVAVVGAVDVFVGDDHAVGSQRCARRQFPLRFRSCGRLVHAEGAVTEELLRRGPGY